MDTGGGAGAAGGGSAAPTGCYKCGRPGHWSRDCPSNPTSNSNNNNKDLDNNPSGTSNYSKKSFNSFQNNALKSGSAAEKPKRLRKTRPKLTPDLLLSNDGLGHILRHFPRAFKYHGRGHEVRDLGNLLGMYAEWHSHLLPYYSFDQFVLKVEQIGTKNRVKKCIQELRERVADGVDPTKLHKPQNQEDMSNRGQVANAMDSEEQNLDKEDTDMQNPDTNNHPENILNEIWENTMEEPSEPANVKMAPSHVSSSNNEALSTDHNDTSSNSNGIVITEEQRARMQAHRLKALEKISEEQRARMQSNRLKALEKAAARTQKLQQV